MIERWKVFNFKSVRAETDLALAPLTIFAGANSSGKSTFLQSMLVVAQTLAHKVSSRSVVLNGALARLGQFDDLKSTASEADQIAIGWVCRPRETGAAASVRPSALGRSMPVIWRGDRALKSVAGEITFDAQETGDRREVTQIQPRLFSTSITAVVRDADGGDNTYFMGVRRATSDDYEGKRQWIDAIPEGDEAHARATLDYQVELDDLSLAEVREDLPSAIPIGCEIRHFLPLRLTLGVDLPTEHARTIVAALEGAHGSLRGRRFSRELIAGSDVVVPNRVVQQLLSLLTTVSEADANRVREALDAPSLFESAGVALDYLVDKLRPLPPRIRMDLRRALADDDEFLRPVERAIRAETSDAIAITHYRLPRALASACTYLDEFFARSVRYLGPLRDEPKSLYPLAPTADPADVGLKGEHTAAVLDLNKNRLVRYVPSTAIRDGSAPPAIATRTLGAAVADWLRYLGVARSVESRDKGKFGHELTVSVAHDGDSHDLTHVGVGVSQVLPILVASLLADGDTTLVFEQPELHLHPKVQTLLADFFLSMTRLGKQCVVETHSEYIVNRLRLRAAEAAPTDSFSSSVKIYFVETGPDGSSFRDVAVNEYGAIADWPAGFFDQSQREAEQILQAAAKKRRRRRDGGNP